MQERQSNGGNGYEAESPTQMRVLLITDTPDIAEDITARALECNLALTVPPEADLAAARAEALPDLVVIRLTGPERFPFDAFQALQDAGPVPAVMLCDEAAPDMLAQAAAVGVHAYLPSGAGIDALDHLAQWAGATMTVTANLKAKLKQQETKLADRIVIERAKGVVMKTRNLPEDTAYHEIRKIAMRRSLTMRAVAEQIIDTADLVMNK